MKNKFIYSPTKSLFEKKLAAGEIGEGSIVFIEDTKEIWNRGHYFGSSGSGSGIDPEVLSGIETAIATLQSDKVDKSELSDYAKKDELPSLDGYLTKTVADGLYATVAQYNALSQTVDNVNSDLQTFKNNVALTYATDQDVADAVAALVDSSPTTLDTLNELAAALGDDPNFATTVATQIGTKADQTALDATNTNVANLTTKVNGNSVSKSGETLTVSINGSTQSLANTWRGVSDAVNSTSSTDSASSKAVKTAYDTAVAAQSAANTAQTTANNKWTYSESTIKGVKVNNASNADTVGGFTVGCNVPANAKFTDNNTTYSAGTGLSLSGTTFNHSNSVTAVGTAGLYKVKYDAQGHITGTSSITKADITGLGIPGSDTNTTYSAGSGLSLSGTTFNHASTVTAGTAGTSSATSGATLAVPYVTVNATGHVTGYGTHTHTISGFSTSDTKNTAGSTNSTSTLYLIGATSQAANPQTYSNSGLYATGGTMYATAYYETSDERLKNFKGDVKVDFDKLKSIPKKYFTWKDDETQILQMGTSAQAVQAIYPELVSDDGTLHVDYARLVIPALAAIDVLYEENKLLKDKLTKLEEAVYGNRR